jgi:hypothetical protein
MLVKPHVAASDIAVSCCERPESCLLVLGRCPAGQRSLVCTAMAVSHDAWHVQLCQCVVMYCTVQLVAAAIVAAPATILCALRMYHHVFVMYSNVLMYAEGYAWSVLHGVKSCALPKLAT